jgi:hypothetical protein
MTTIAKIRALQKNIIASGKKKDPHWVEKNEAVWVGRALAEYLREHKFYPGTSVAADTYSLFFVIESKVGKLHIDICVLDSGIGSVSICRATENGLGVGAHGGGYLEETDFNVADPKSFPTIVETIQKWVKSS